MPCTRRDIGRLAALLSLSGASASVPAWGADATGLQARLEALAARARPGLLGIAVEDMADGRQWLVHADRAYPMMSVFKAPLAAAALWLVDHRHLSLRQEVVLTRADLRDGVSAIAAQFHGGSMRFTLAQLLEAAVSHSDNSAADALLRLVGGGRVVTGFLQAHGIAGMRVDIGEGAVSRIFSGLNGRDTPSKGETPAARAARERHGLAAYLADPRNRATPKAAIAFLRKLWLGQLLSPQSRHRLLDLMYGQTTPVRLRAGLPVGVRLADKCGTSVTVDGITAAYNDIGILAGPKGRAVLIAAFLTASPASRQARDAIFADLARAVSGALRI